MEKLIAERAGSVETEINNSGPLKPTLAVTWPEDEFPQNPHQCFAISGWHCFRGSGNWDVDRMAEEVSDRIQFSESESATDLSEGVEDRWQGFTFSPREGVIVMVRELSLLSRLSYFCCAIVSQICFSRVNTGSLASKPTNLCSHGPICKHTTLRLNMAMPTSSMRWAGPLRRKALRQAKT